MRQFRNCGLMLTTIVLAALVSMACGGNEPVSVRALQETREAAVAEAEIEATTAAEERTRTILSQAPEGTVFAETEPSREHDSTISIPLGTKPPMGGVHHPSWQRCDVYEEPVKVEHAMHALEHGGVWITYAPDVDEETIERLGEYTNREPFVMVSPYPNLESPIMLTAWGLQLSLDSAEDARIQDFIDAYANGPQTPEPGTNCATGVRSTIEE